MKNNTITQVLIFGLSLFLYISCSKKEKPFYPTNIKEKTFELKAQKYTYDTLKSPYKPFIINDNLYVTQDTKVNFDEPLIHIFNKESMERKGAIGKNGMGPNEMLFASLLDYDLSDSTVIVFDSRKKSFSEFDKIPRSKNSLLARNQIRLSSDMHDAYKVYKASDSTYLAVSTQKQYIFNEYDTNGKWIRGYGKWPGIPNEKLLSGFTGIERNYLLGEINAGSLKKEIGGDWYGYAMRFRDRVELFNYRTKEYKSVKGPELIDEIQPFKIAGSGKGLGGAYDFMEAIRTYIDIAFQPKYIYTLYAGVSQTEVRNTGQFAQIVFVFSYDSELVGQLNLNKSLRSFEVDEELGRIYGITIDENPGVAVFDIPEEILNRD